MKFSGKIVGNFEGIFVGIEEPSILDKSNDPKYKLTFAPHVLLSNTKETIEPLDTQRFLGAIFKSKISKDELKKMTHLLKIGELYHIRAAIDSYSLTGNSGNTVQGLTFSILDLERVPSGELSTPHA